jgi:hypothetical protein
MATTPARFHTALPRACASIDDQTYPEIEHLIISDGPNQYLSQLDHSCFPFADKLEHIHVQRRTAWLARNHGHPAIPFAIGSEMACGDLLLYLADDSELERDCIEQLVRAIDDVDFAYPAMAIEFDDRPSVRIGANPPAYGSVSAALFRRELLDIARFGNSGQWDDDWLQVKAWMAAGKTWRYVPDVLIRGHGDHVGAVRLPGSVV